MRKFYGGSLHNHTDFSNARLRDCINKYDDLINYAIELGHEVIAITAHESVMGAVKINKYAQKIKEKNPNFRVILGNEIYLCRNGLNASNFNKEEDKYYHIILLAKDLIGFKQICEISTRAWQRSYMARGMRRVPTYYQDLIDIIGKNPGHIIGSTACLGGALGTQILKLKNKQKGPSFDTIISWTKNMELLFGKNNFYLELQPSDSKEQTIVNRALIEISKVTNIPYIITTDSHYLRKEDKSIHKAYLNSQDGDREVDDFYATTYMMDTKELESHLDLSEEELEYAYSNILKIKESCQDYSILKPLKIPSLKWRKFEHNENDFNYYRSAINMLETFRNSEHEADKELAWAIIQGIKEHEDLQNQRAYDEINSNLEMTWQSSEVNKAQWSAYYLNLQKIIDICWEAGTIVGPGRGSGVGFILLYVLGITQINPLRETTKMFSWRSNKSSKVSYLW